MPSARKFIAKPETIWSARSVTEKSAWISASATPATMPISRPMHPRAGDLGAPQPPEGAHQHHALEADVDDAAALGEQPAEGGEQQRRGVAQHRGEQAPTTRPRGRGSLTPDCVAAMPTAMPAIEAATAPQPSRFSPLREPPSAPAAMPASPSTTRSGSASGSSAAAAPRRTPGSASATPAQPTRAAGQPARRARRARRPAPGARRVTAHAGAPPPARRPAGAASRAAATGRRRGCRRSPSG